MQQQLESISYDSGKIIRRGKSRIYAPRSLEFGVTAAYTGDSFMDTGGGFAFPPLRPLSPEPVGTSFFIVELPRENTEDKCVRVSNSEELKIIGGYKVIDGESGRDVFNPDGSLAGRIKNLNQGELLYLKYLDKFED
jgi:hypothetical protein